MPTETLHFDNARIAQQLFDNQPQNIQSAEACLDVTLTARDGWIKIEGSDENIHRARALFQLLETSIKSGSPVRSRDFAHALTVVRDDGVAALQELFSDR